MPANRYLACAALAAVATLPVTAAGAGRRLAPPAAAIVRLSSGGSTIPLVRTARGLTTRIALPEEAREAICGDLYDAAANAGGFVVQRSGHDLFVKPLRGATESNLFVKTERATYAFDLVVVEAARAMRIVYVDEAAPERAAAADAARLAEERKRLEAERAEARSALERGRAALEVAADERASGRARELLRAAVVADSGLIEVSRRRARAGRFEAIFGPALVVLDGTGFLRCQLRNDGPEPVTIDSIAVASRSRVPVGVRVPPRSSSSVVLELPVPAVPGTTISFMSGATAILTARPF